MELQHDDFLHETAVLELMSVGMRYLVLGLFFAVWTIVALAAEPQDVVGLKLELVSFQRMYVQGEFPNQRLTSYRIGASVVTTTDLMDVHHNNSEALGKSMAEPKNDLFWVARDNWPLITRDGSLSLTPLLRLESKGQMIDIKPRRHSLLIQYRLNFN